MPAAFLPLIQESRLAERLDLFVLECALRRARAWCDAGLAIPVYVNFSPQSLQARGLPEKVEALLEQSHLPAALLKLELTELPGKSAALTLEIARSFDRIGVELILDDFGTGHSSLGRLLALPFESLKIDRRYVAAIVADRRMEAIVKACIDIGHSLGVKVTAEGVETESVWRRLRALGCDRAQGYLISPPLDADDLTGWLASEQVRSLAAPRHGAHAV
jgi:EAL domain-containing protein (putative c-di-GMP-specific phosphodiesterase class I)